MPPKKFVTRRPRRTQTSWAVVAAKRKATAKKIAHPNSMTLLEACAVGATTSIGYRRHAEGFTLFCDSNKLDWKTPEGLDKVLVGYLNVLFLDGASRSEASQVVAGIRHFSPMLTSRGGSELPRVHRALQGWSKLAPSAQRLPIPRCLALAIAGLMIIHNQPAMAVFVMVSYVCYLRPSECMRLVGKSLVPPVQAQGPNFRFWGIVVHDADLGVAGKTGITDESVLIDMDDWLLPALQALRETRPLEAPLWTFSLDEVREMFARAVERLDAGGVQAHLYGLRHGGASHDLLTRRRTLLEVKFRGRWSSDTSLKRYAKATRLQKEMEKLPLHCVALGNATERNFARMITARARGLPLPVAVPARLVAPL